MSQSRETANIVEELLKLRPGKVRCFLDADFDSVQRSLRGRPADVRRPILLLKRIDTIPTAAQFVSEVLFVMATAARNLWPVWFTDIDFGTGRSAADRGAAQLKISHLHGHLRGLSPTWGRRAVAKVMDGRLPLVSGFPRATQLHQLRLTISRSGLVLVLALAGKEEDMRLASLTNAVLWLARNAKLAIAVFLPGEVANRAALAQIAYDPITCVTTSTVSGTTTSCGINIVVDDDVNKSTTVWLWLGEGRTHPQSAVEAKLAKALREDAELGSLFSANQSRRDDLPEPADSRSALA